MPPRHSHGEGRGGLADAPCSLDCAATAASNVEFRCHAAAVSFVCAAADVLLALLEDASLIGS